MLCWIPQLGSVNGRGRYEGKDGQEIVMDCHGLSGLLAKIPLSIVYL
jgi:hypothetical protein